MSESSRGPSGAVSSGANRGGSARWRLEAAARTHRGLVRTENQDAYGLFEESACFVVADGLGGHRAGRFASQLAVEVVRQALAVAPDGPLEPVTDGAGLGSLGARRLVLALDAANLAIQAAARDPDRAGMGTTIVALLFDAASDVAAVCHVGDSRAFRLRGGELIQLTEDHTLVHEWVREGRIRPEDVAGSPHRHVVTQAVGTQDHVRPVVRLERPRTGDVFLLTSDGIHDGVTPAEMVAAVHEASGGLDEACGRLIARANERGGSDNATVAMIRVGDPVT